MRALLILAVGVTLCSCRKGDASKPAEPAANQGEQAANQGEQAATSPGEQTAKHESRHPYENVTPEKVKERLEQIRQQKEERDERRLREAQ